MSLAQIESFVAVAEERTVTAAAARLHVSQPPLTRRIRQLESELGHPLFIRSARGMDLSPAGTRLLPWAREVLAHIGAAKHLLDGLAPTPNNRRCPED